MGVPKFFRWISERYPCLSELIKEYQIPEFDHLYLDMNGIIHNCSHPNDFDPHFRITEEKIFQDIFHYIEVLFRMIQPKRLFFMAVDGVAPRAKQNQQRGRRFRSAKDAEVLEAKAKEKGEALPTAARFDSNCITPGTPFMARLQEQLKFFIAYKISNDELWQRCKVILSGHETPGEGEHKIMDYIRYMKAQPDYDSNTRHCLYGLDADLIMLGLCTHEPHFSLLREEVRFGGKKKQDKIASPEQTTFFLLHLSLMREYLEHEFLPVKDKLSEGFTFDLESIIDDWVLMGFLVGNDFIPPLPELHIHTGALPILYQTYIKVLPTLGGYINENGTLNLTRFQQYMQELAKFDLNQFDDKFADLQYFQSKTGRKPGAKERPNYSRKRGNRADKKSLAIEMDSKIGFCDSADSSEVSLVECEEKCVTRPLADGMLGEGDGPAAMVSAKEPLNAELAAFMSGGLMDVWNPDDEASLSVDSDEEGESLMEQEFRQHKHHYYMDKLEYEQVTPEVLRSQAEGYVRAIQWNLNYYYNGVCSWSWFYPHHYAPYISDIRDFADMTLEFEMGQPFLPFQQLAAVLPAASMEHLPKAYQWLMVDPKSPIIHYYPSDFETDLNGKRQEWEAVVLIPFIDEKLLLEAMSSCDDQLTEEEVARNRHGPMSVFTYTPEDLGSRRAPEYFPTVAQCHALETLVEREEIAVPRERLVRGLCPDVKLDVYFPGFPTLKHIKHKGALQKMKVKVFDNPSRDENMILSILQQSVDVKEVAADILGNTIYVQWPHLVEALVTRVSTAELCYETDPTSGALVERAMTGAETAGWHLSRKAITEAYIGRRGIKVGDISVLVTAKTMTGRKYVFGQREGARITLEKQWADMTSTFALQATVRDISVHDEAFTQYRTVDEVFPAGSTCFLLAPKFYGLLAEVAPGAMPGRVKVTATQYSEPDLDAARRKAKDSRTLFMTGGHAAAKLGISSHLLSRITGNIFVQLGVNNNSHRVNIGLGLKYSKKNEEIPGYTRRDANGASWLYSQASVELVNSFMQAFPDLFDYLSVNTGKDPFEEEEMFPDKPGRALEVTQWLKQQPYTKLEPRTCGSLQIEPEVVAAVEAALDVERQTVKRSTVQLWPTLLYKPELHIGNLPPDPGTAFVLFDRVVNTRKGFTVPLGLRGVVIAIQKGEKEEDELYDVLFDEEFTGGLALNCSANRGYRMPPSALINISHGRRKEEGVQAPADANWTSTPVDRSRPQRAASVFDNTGLNGVPQVITRAQPRQPQSNWRERPAPAAAPAPSYKLLTKREEAMAAPNQDFSAMWESLSAKLPVEARQPAPKPRSQPQPQPQHKSAETEANNLMKLLKIQRDVQPPAQVQPQKLMTQISVEDMFTAARESKVAGPGPSSSAKLMSHFQTLGLGMPRYNQIKHPLTGQFKATITLPNAMSFVGVYADDIETASNSAAQLALNHMGRQAQPPPPPLWWRDSAQPQQQFYQPLQPSGQHIAQMKPMIARHSPNKKQIPPHVARSSFLPAFATSAGPGVPVVNRSPAVNQVNMVNHTSQAPVSNQPHLANQAHVSSTKPAAAQAVPLTRRANQERNGTSPRFVPIQATQHLIRVTGPPVLRDRSLTPKQGPQVAPTVDAQATSRSKPKRLAANFNMAKKKTINQAAARQ